MLIILYPFYVFILPPPSMSSKLSRYFVSQSKRWSMALARGTIDCVWVKVALIIRRNFLDQGVFDTRTGVSNGQAATTNQIQRPLAGQA